MTCRVAPALLAFCAVASITLGGCGGGGHPGYSSPAPGGTYAYSYPDPWEHVYDSRLRHPDAPAIAPRQPTELFLGELGPVHRTWGGYLSELHVELSAGHNVVGAAQYVAGSGNVTVDEDDPWRVVRLRSTRDTVSFITYVFDRLSGDEVITQVEVYGEGSFGSSRQDGLYIGIRPFDERSYEWYGPLWRADDWGIPLWPGRYRWAGGHAYVTLAVFDGDEFAVDQLRIEVSY